MNRILCYFAGLGFFVSLAVHLISLSGVYVGNKAPIDVILFAGILIVLLATIFKLKNNHDLHIFGNTRSSGILKYIKIIYKDTPRFVITLMIVSVLYAVLNFYLSKNATGGEFPDIIDSKYMAIKYSSIMKEITESEYWRMKANEYRYFSGQWMAIFAFFVSILWPHRKSQNT